MKQSEGLFRFLVTAGEEDEEEDEEEDQEDEEEENENGRFQS